MVDVIRRMQEAPELAATGQVSRPYAGNHKTGAPTRAGITDLALILIKRKNKYNIRRGYIAIADLKNFKYF